MSPLATTHAHSSSRTAAYTRLLSYTCLRCTSLPLLVITCTQPGQRPLHTAGVTRPQAATAAVSLTSSCQPLLLPEPPHILAPTHRATARGGRGHTLTPANPTPQARHARRSRTFRSSSRRLVAPQTRARASRRRSHGVITLLRSPLCLRRAPSGGLACYRRGLPPTVAVNQPGRCGGRSLGSSESSSTARQREAA